MAAASETILKTRFFDQTQPNKMQDNFQEKLNVSKKQSINQSFDFFENHSFACINSVISVFCFERQFSRKGNLNFEKPIENQNFDLPIKHNFVY